MLGQRILVAVVGIPLFVWLAWLGDLPFLLLIILVVGIASYELERLTAHLGRLFSPPWQVLLAPSLTLGVRFDPTTTIAVAGAAGFVGLARAEYLAGRRTTTPAAALVRFAAFLATALYPTLAGCLLPIRALPGGFGLVMATVGAVWANDTAAYLVGRTWGRHQLVPGLSPGKSAEGLVAGSVAALVFWLAATIWTGLGSAEALLMGAVCALTAPAGDLLESMLKRAAGAKDSGNVLPGHGGILDRFDSLLLVAPASWLLLLVLI